MATYKCRRCGIIRNDFQRVLLALTPQRCKPGLFSSSGSVSSHAWYKISNENIY